MLYLSDEDLYLYNGKEKKLLQEKINAVWSPDAMETKADFSGMYWD